MKISGMTTMYWLLKRELWEHRGGFVLTPLITGGVFVLLNVMGIIAAEISGDPLSHVNIIGDNMNLLDQAMHAEDAARLGMGLDMMMLFTSSLLLVVLGFTTFFYCLGTLYDDRRDRSLLFWKSLPVSDTAMVLSKLITAAVVAPAITVICGILTGIAMLLIFAVTLSFHGIDAWHLLTLAHPLRITADMIGSIPLYAIWALPAMGWLLMCSAWARSKPFLWAVALPIGVGAVLSWFNLLGSIDVGDWYWTHVCGRLLLSTFPYGWLGWDNLDAFRHGLGVLETLHLGNAYTILASPTVWIHAAAGAVMVAVAIWLRRTRSDL